MKIKLTRILLIIIAGAIWTVNSGKVWAATYQDARTEYLQSVDAFRSMRDDYLKVREKLKMVRTEGMIQETLGKAKAFLLQADKTAILYLRMVREKVEEVGGVSETERTAALMEIDNDIAWFTSKQIEIEAATDRETLLSLAGAVKNYWQKARVDVKRISGRILVSSGNFVLNKLTDAGMKIKEIVDRRQEAGRDVSSLIGWYEDYQEKLDLAGDKYGAAKEKYTEIVDLGDANTLFNQVTAFVREGNQYLRAARADLQNMVELLRKK